MMFNMELQASLHQAPAVAFQSSKAKGLGPGNLDDSFGSGGRINLKERLDSSVEGNKRMVFLVFLPKAVAQCHG